MGADNSWWSTRVSVLEVFTGAGIDKFDAKTYGKELMLMTSLKFVRTLMKDARI